MTIIVKKVSSESFELDVKIPRVVSIKLEQGALKRLDAAWKKAGYKSRSDFIRDAIKIYIELLEEASGLGRDGYEKIDASISASKEELLKKIAKRNNMNIERE